MAAAAQSQGPHGGGGGGYGRVGPAALGVCDPSAPVPMLAGAVAWPLLRPLSSPPPPTPAIQTVEPPSRKGGGGALIGRRLFFSAKTVGSPKWSFRGSLLTFCAK